MLDRHGPARQHGALALVAAFVVGAFVVGQEVPDETLTAFPADLFLILVGVTYLFAIAKNNGSADWLVQAAVRLVRGRVALIPWVMFVVISIMSRPGSGGDHRPDKPDLRAAARHQAGAHEPAVSAFASTTGILAALIPLAVPLLLGGEIGAVSLIIALALSSSIVDSSPFSTSGALCVATSPDDLRDKVYKSLLRWGMSMIVVIPITTWLVFVLPGQYIF